METWGGSQNKEKLMKEGINGRKRSTCTGHDFPLALIIIPSSRTKQR